MAGRRVNGDMVVDGLASVRMFAAKGRRTFVMVTLKRDKSGGWLVEPAPVSLSGAITTLARADGFVEIPENVQFIDSGEKVRVYLFRKLEEGEF
jgi:putative molybdopterin biosynthesis protein